MLADHFEQALALHRAGALDQAEALYRNILQKDAEHAGAWHLLGVLLHSRRDLPTALEYVEKALSLCQSKAAYWNNYGAILKDLDRFEDAKTAFEKALAIRDNYADARSNLGLVQTELGRLEQAEQSLRYALRLDPRHADALRHLAVVSREKGQFEEALRLCGDAATVAPHNAKVYEIQGETLVQMKRFHEAVAAFEEAIARDPAAAEAHLNQGFAYSDLGDHERARESFHRAAHLHPDRPMWQRRHLGLCPTVFQTANAVTEYRSELERQLDASLAEAPSFQWRNALRDGFSPSFQLSFHGACNRRIKEKMARLFAAAFPSERPKFGEGSKIRVGFLCTRTHETGFVRGFGGIMQRLDRRRFDVVGLVSDKVVPYCQRLVPTETVRWIGFPQHLEQAWKIVQETQCDIIVHWHAGSDILNYFLPFLPLAPVQCIGFGANGTTGIPTIDCFLSSRLFERGTDAEEDYTEQLVQFEGLTTWQPRPRIVQPATRADFGLPSSGAIYFCPQQLGKFHPHFDHRLQRIL